MRFKTLSDRFWSKVDKRGPDECWPWKAGILGNGGGYGAFALKVDGKWQMGCSHRMAWALANGREPGELVVCHQCDNPPCCNPKHLFVGTQKENLDDCRSKDRHVHDERHYRCEVSSETVIEMRRMRVSGATTEEIAEKFGVKKHHVLGICAGSKRKNVDTNDCVLLRPRKLDAVKVAEIRSLVAAGMRTGEIARKFNVDPSTVSHIKSGHNWSRAS